MVQKEVMKHWAFFWYKNLRMEESNDFEHFLCTLLTLLYLTFVQHLEVNFMLELDAKLGTLLLLLFNNDLNIHL